MNKIIAPSSTPVLTQVSHLDSFATPTNGFGTPTNDNSSINGFATPTNSFGTSNNGLNFNITVVFDGATYIENNLKDFGNYIQASWVLDVLNMFLHNSNNRSNISERIQLDKQKLREQKKDYHTPSLSCPIHLRTDRLRVVARQRVRNPGKQVVSGVLCQATHQRKRFSANNNQL